MLLQLNPPIWVEDAGMLVISGIKRKFAKYQCGCGNQFVARIDHIKRGQKSCGCVVTSPRNRRAYNAKPDGMAAAHQVYACYRQKCKKKGIRFELEFGEFLALANQRCYYCGAPPSAEFKSWFTKGPRSGKHKVNGSFKYNGIDRTDPSKGYVAGNMQPCCRYCNSAKLDRTEAEFLAWIENLCKHALPVEPTDMASDAKGEGASCGAN